MTPQEALKNLPSEQDLMNLDDELRDVINEADIDIKDKRVLCSQSHGVCNYYRRLVRRLEEASNVPAR